MLEKDPMKRIDASSALSHIYFSSNMDLEIPKELKINVKEYLSPKNKMTNETPTTVNGKSLGRLLLQSSHSFEQRPATFLSWMILTTYYSDNTLLYTIYSVL